MNKTFFTTLLLLTLALSGAPMYAADDTTKSFEALAATNPILDTDRLLYGYPPFSNGSAGNQNAAQKELDEDNAKFAAMASRASVEELKGLLHRADPKVRGLALAALFQKDDPQVLPDIATLADDPAETLHLTGGQPQRAVMDFVPEAMHQTVGDVATKMIKFYMEPAGYFYGIKGVGQEPGFTDYWQKRKDRKYCASWFAVQVLQALRGGLPASKENLPAMQRVRDRIDQLPPDDRAWTLLWLRDVYPDQDEFGPAYANILVSKEDLVKILQGLGPDKLLLRLQHKTPTDDPDMAAGAKSYRGGGEATMFLLAHATDLFRPGDADALLAQGQREIDDSREGNRTPWWWLAAARLQPDRAGAILHQGYDALKKADTGEDAFNPLVMALWDGGGETDFVTDWFYSTRAGGPAFAHVDSRGRFVDALAKMGRKADKALTAHLLQDSRATTLDPEMLSHFAVAINGWLATPLVSAEELGRLRHRTLKGGPNKAPEMVPGLLERLQKSVPQWEA